MISTSTAFTGSLSFTYGHSSSGLHVQITPAPTTSPPTMTGTVSFYNGGLFLGSAGVGWDSGTNTGFASIGYAPSPVGSNPIVAVYSGDPNYEGSTGSGTATVAKAPLDHFDLTEEPNPFTFGAYVFLDVEADARPFCAVPTGTVVFDSSVGVLGTVALDQIS